MRREEPSPAPGMPLASGRAELRHKVMRVDRRSLVSVRYSTAKRRPWHKITGPTTLRAQVDST